MQLDSLYQEVILDHYKRPQHKGLAATYDAQVHHVNPSCGDEITLNVALEGDKVAAITWDGVGCSISQASVSILSDLLLGKSISEADLILNNFTELMQSKGTMVSTKYGWQCPKEFTAIPETKSKYFSPVVDVR